MPVLGASRGGTEKRLAPRASAPAPDGPAPSEETGEEAGLEVDLRGTGLAASGASGCRGGGVGRFFPVQTEEEPGGRVERGHMPRMSQDGRWAHGCVPHTAHFGALQSCIPPATSPPSLLAHPWSRD